MSKTQFLKNKQTSISQCIFIPGLLEQDRRVLCCKPTENTSSCRASDRRISPFSRDPSVALLTAAWHDCTCIKPHLNGKLTFSSQERTTVTVGNLETLAMLEFSRLQRISVLPTDMVFILPDTLLGYNCTMYLYTTWINCGPFLRNCRVNWSMQWETKTWTASANRKVRAA